MQFLCYLPIIIFSNYLHVNAIMFNCSVPNPYKKDKYLLEYLSGQVTWNIKYLGRNHTDYYNKMLGRCVKIFLDGKLTETSYFMYDSEENTLLKLSSKADIHDKYFALQSTTEEYALVKYVGTEIQNPHGYIEVPETNPITAEMALIDYGITHDIYIYQSCHDKNVVTVEVGDKTMRKLARGDEEFKKFLDEKINNVLKKANISSRNNFTELNELFDIFP